MPGLDVSKPLLDTSAAAATAWGSVEGRAGVTFTSALEVNRGVNIDLGVGALAQLDGAIRKYLAADLAASAQAEARATGQIQVPMNLFAEAGLAIRLQLVAQAAAGVQLRLGLSIGDFLALVDGDPAMAGLPSRLLLILLEEADIGGGLYAKAAVSAMAYANVVIAARLIATPTSPAGFTVSAEAGAGLKAGCGFRVFANLGIAQPRRLVARSIDVLVDETIAGLSRLLPPDQAGGRALLEAVRAPAKMGLRTAYEIGDLIARGQAPQDANGADRLALRCVQVMLEESQRFLLERLSRLGLGLFHELLDTSTISQVTWDAARQQRVKLADTLARQPVEPFVVRPENLSYWKTLVDDAVALTDALASGAIRPELREPLAIVWASVQLLFAAMQRAVETQASFAAIGLTPRQVHSAFDAPITAMPPTSVRDAINARIGAAPGTVLTAAALVQFLGSTTVIDALSQRFPEVRIFLEMFRGPLGSTAAQIAPVLLSNIGSLRIGGAPPDPQRTLETLAGALRVFLEDQIDAQLVPLVRPQLAGRPDLQLYFDEVMLPSLRIATNLVPRRTLEWSQGTIAPKTMTEVLSGILLMLFGRSAVVTLDVLLARGQERLRDELLQLAELVEQDRNDPRNIVPILAAATPFSRQELAELCSETLRIGADVFGPLPAQTRTRIRSLLYELLETLPPGDPTALADQLADTSFIPNVDRARDLAVELASYAGRNIEAFVTRVLLRAAEMVLEAVEELIEELVGQVQRWIGELEDAAAELAARLRDLAREIDALVREVQRQFDLALDGVEDLLRALSSETARSGLRSELVSKVSDHAIGALRDVPGYDLVPQDLRSHAKRLVRDAVRGLIDNEFTDVVLDGAGTIADAFADVLDDIRGLDPNRSLTPQIRELLLDRIEDGIREAFGGDDPRFPLSVRVEAFGFEKTLDLGRVRVPLGEVISAARWAFSGIALTEDTLRTLAQTVAGAFAAEAALVAKEGEQSELEDEHGQVRHQLADSRVGPVEITVLEPVPGGGYDRDLTLRINLAGAPVSFLGLGELEQPRVKVWLNTKLLPLAAFAIEEHDAGVPARADGASLHPVAGAIPQPGSLALPEVPPPDRTSGGPGHRELSGRGGSETAGSFRVLRRVAPGETVGRWGLSANSGGARPAALHPDAAAKQAMAPLVAHWVTASIAGTRARRGPAGVRTDRPRSSIKGRGVLPAPDALLLGPAVSGRPGTAPGAPPRLGPSLAGGTGPGRPPLGRTLTVTQLGALGARLQSGLLISLPIALGELREGVNTVTVAVIHGAGERVTRSVAFLALPKATPPAVAPGMRPGRSPDFGRRRDARPPEGDNSIRLPNPGRRREPATPAAHPQALFPSRAERGEAVSTALDTLRAEASSPRTAVRERIEHLRRHATEPEGLGSRATTEGPA